MSLEPAGEHRAYIDRSAQTSPTLDTTLLAAEPSEVSGPMGDVSSVSVLLEGLALSEKTALRPSTQHEDSMEKPLTMDSTLRYFKRTHLPERRPSSTSTTLSSTTTRIVSLPETVSEYSEKKALRKTVKKRVVSMPVEQDKLGADTAQGGGSPECDVSVENILPDHDRPSRIRVCSHATDTPRTPSPPSSPESIVIIGRSSDDDWVNWARSPPRPIPALHGPSSLPYARCPSGAEGTIIEGQENLPQVIWGLENEDSARARSEPPQPVPSASVASSGRKTIPKSSSQNVHAKVPPRFSKMSGPPRTEALPLAANPTPYVSFSDASRRVPEFGFNDLHTAADHNYVIPAHGPIDLNLLARPRSAIGLYPVPPGSEFSSNSAYAPSVLHVHGHQEDLDTDWQAYSAEQNAMLNSSASRYGGINAMTQPLEPSYAAPPLSSSSHAFMDVPSQPVSLTPGIPYLYSPLSTQSTPLNTPNTVDQISQRMSALEIAQKYRQKQLLQTQPSASLPTPPSSTSPLWSSGFSPYLESMWSPDVRGTGSWANASLSLASSHNRLPAPGSTELPGSRPQVQPVVPSVADRGNHRGSTLPLGLDSLPGRVSDYMPSSNAIDLALLHSSRGLSQGERRFVRPNVRAIVSGMPTSPVVPKPPPNTPSQTLSMKQATYTRPSIPSTTSLAAPPSPTSPDFGSLASSRQTSRSIPLNRLIQRRLSSVPEEGSLVPERKPLPRFEKPGARPPRHSTPVILNPDGTLSIAPRVARPPPPAYSFADEPSIAPSIGLKQHAPVAATTKPAAKQARPQNALPRVRQHTDGGANVVESSEQSQKNKTRARNGKRGRHQSASASNGPERVDGGLTVRS